MSTNTTPASELYAVLQVSPSASHDTIKASYRCLDLRDHPDRNKSPNATTITQEINAAWEILGNAKKRSEYDLSHARAHQSSSTSAPRSSRKYGSRYSAPPRPSSRPRPSASSSRQSSTGSYNQQLHSTTGRDDEQWKEEMRHQEYKWCRECDLDEQREEEMRRRDYEEHLRAREKRHRQNECCRECDLGEQRKEEKRRRDYQEYVRARQKHHRGYAGCRCRKCDMDDLLRGWAASGGSLIEGQRYRRI